MPEIPALGRMRQEGQSEAGLCYVKTLSFYKEENKKSTVHFSKQNGRNTTSSVQSS